MATSGSDLHRGITALKQAAAVEASGDPWGAIPIYMEGLEHLNVAYKAETDSTRKQTIRARMEEYMTRVEHLRAAQRTRTAQWPNQRETNVQELPAVPAAHPAPVCSQHSETDSAGVAASDVGTAAAVGGLLGAATLGVAAAPIAAGALAYQASQADVASDTARSFTEKGWNGLAAGASTASAAAGELGLSGGTKVGETTASGVGAAAAVGGIAAVATLGVGLGAVVAPVAAAGMAAASTQSGDRGDAVRAVAGAGARAYNTAADLDAQYDVTGKTVTAVKWTAGTATQINNDYDVTGKVQSAVKGASQWADEHKVVERVGLAASAASAVGKDVAAWVEEHKVMEKTSEATTRLIGGARSVAATWTNSESHHTSTATER